MARKCTKCNVEYPDQILFCTQCGMKTTMTENTPWNGGGFETPGNGPQITTPINENQTGGVGGGNKGSKLPIILGIVLALLLCVIVAIVLIFVVSGKEEDKNDNVVKTEQAANDVTDEPEQESDSDTGSIIVTPSASNQSEGGSTEEAIEVEEVPVVEEAEEIPEYEEPIQNNNVYEEDLASKFGINSYTVTDYRASLDPADYVYYGSGISDFGFYVPTNLYNSVSSIDGTRSDYGDVVEGYVFSGTDGSGLRFSAIRRTDYRSYDELLSYISRNENGKLVDSWDIVNKNNGSYAKVVTTGWNDSNHSVVYYTLYKIEPDYIMEMVMYYPGYANDTEWYQKTYINEMVYRKCVFGECQYPVISYEEYVSTH